MKTSLSLPSPRKCIIYYASIHTALFVFNHLLVVLADRLQNAWLWRFVLAWLSQWDTTVSMISPFTWVATMLLFLGATDRDHAQSPSSKVMEQQLLHAHAAYSELRASYVDLRRAAGETARRQMERITELDDQNRAQHRARDDLQQAHLQLQVRHQALIDQRAGKASDHHADLDISASSRSVSTSTQTTTSVSASTQTTTSMSTATQTTASVSTATQTTASVSTATQTTASVSTATQTTASRSASTQTTASRSTSTQTTTSVSTATQTTASVSTPGVPSAADGSDHPDTGPSVAINERRHVDSGTQTLQLTTLEDKCTELMHAAAISRTERLIFRFGSTCWRKVAARRGRVIHTLTAEQHHLRQRATDHLQDVKHAVSRISRVPMPIVFTGHIATESQQASDPYSFSGSKHTLSLSSGVAAKTPSLPLTCSFDFLCFRGPRAEVLVQSVLWLHAQKGNRVCFAADGESGTGKTYGTFTGPRSVARQALSHVLAAARNSPEDGLARHTIKMALTEWYPDAAAQRPVAHDQLRDLAPESAFDLTETSTAKATGESWYVFEPGSGMHHDAVVDRFLKIALARRNTATTAMNESSSRGHLTFHIVVGDRDRPKDHTNILIVDLAGSELGMPESLRRRTDPDTKFIHSSRQAILQQLHAFAGREAVARDTRSLRPWEDFLKAQPAPKVVYATYFALHHAELTATRQVLARVQELQDRQRLAPHV
ncbi:hypothetical protein PV04_09768 [Phialophora macrospora]|uniref:Kinesin motor domain-containing protein n=1 Tax=Phialophora macrospora TaxID=1851006 RepID=A0A0D2CCT6_9EURO|nr:hypothetical protein PV04_09768 [Phialophora macrospora]